MDPSNNHAQNCNHAKHFILVDEVAMLTLAERDAALTVDEIGNTELHILVIYNQCEKVRQLRHSLDNETWQLLLSIKNKDSNTPGDLCGSHEMTTVLLKAYYGRFSGYYESLKKSSYSWPSG